MYDYPIQTVPLDHVRLHDAFWQARLDTARTVTIPTVFRKCEDEGRIDNFKKAGGLLPGPFRGEMPFDDSDVYKAIEGASYSLMVQYDSDLDTYLDQIIDYIAKAQEPDGYLYTNRTIDPQHVHPFAGKTRWSSLVQSHELYNCGHLYEAAAAHYMATGKRSLLDIALKNAYLVCDTFGPGRRNDVPGHEIIEMGLVKLYRITGEERFLQRARFFLEARGRHETRQRYDFEGLPEYSQDHLPVLEQREAVGHAVRAMYLYSGMTDVAALYDDPEYRRALEAIWKNCVGKKTYLTGGIGARRRGESFGDNYELPNATAYNETCAAIGSVLWNHRMFLLNGEGVYYDVIEQTLYNGLLSGISLSGDKFFYTNPLESDGQYAFNFGSATRNGWFDVSCCPTNLCRFLPSLSGYVYAVSDNTIYFNLYVQGSATIDTKAGLVEVKTVTMYPWDGHVHVKIIASPPSGTYRFCFRLPGWTKGRILDGSLYRSELLSKSLEAEEPSVLVNNKEYTFQIDNGYIVIERVWAEGDVVDLEFPMPIRKVICDKRVVENREKAALQRGPIVYCIEEQDCAMRFDEITMRNFSDASLLYDESLLGGVVVIQGRSIRAIPYYAWSNRGVGKMQVWMPEK
jgi:DUF1680 family protein